MYFDFFSRYFQDLHGAKIEKIYTGIFSENTPSQPCPHTMCPVSSLTHPYRKLLFCIILHTSLCTSHCNYTFLFLPYFYTKGSNYIHCSEPYFLTQNNNIHLHQLIDFDKFLSKNLLADLKKRMFTTKKLYRNGPSA